MKSEKLEYAKPELNVVGEIGDITLNRFKAGSGDTFVEDEVVLEDLLES